MILWILPRLTPTSAISRSYIETIKGSQAKSTSQRTQPNSTYSIHRTRQHIDDIMQIIDVTLNWMKMEMGKEQPLRNPSGKFNGSRQRTRAICTKYWNGKFKLYWLATIWIYSNGSCREKERIKTPLIIHPFKWNILLIILPV